MSDIARVLKVARLHIWKRIATPLIACMLIALWTGRKPTKRTFEMICFSFCGLAVEDDLMAHIEKLKK